FGALAADDGQRLALADALGGADHVTPIRAVFNLARDTLPVLLERVETLHQHLELEAQTGVADLFAAQGPDTSVDVLARDQRLDLLDAEEVLLVERAQPFDARLELFQLPLDLRRVHRPRAIAARAP